MKRIFNIKDIETVYCEKAEQETCINISRDDNKAIIWTSDNTMVTKLSKIFDSNKDTWECYEGSRNSDGKVTGYKFITLKKAISFRSGKGRDLSEEQREKLSERFKEYHENKGSVN